MSGRGAHSNPEGSQETGREFVKCIRNLLTKFDFYKGDMSITPFGSIENFEDGYTRGEDPTVHLSNGQRVNFDFRFRIRTSERSLQCFGEAKFRNPNVASTEFEKQLLKFLKECILAYDHLIDRYQSHFYYIFIPNQFFSLSGINLNQINERLELKNYLFNREIDSDDCRRNKVAVQRRIESIRNLVTELSDQNGQEVQNLEDQISEGLANNLIIWILPTNLIRMFLGDVLV